jgi:alpha-glucosidase (family GH31 glycosyl hydrolase)
LQYPPEVSGLYGLPSRIGDFELHDTGNGIPAYRLFAADHFDDKRKENNIYAGIPMLFGKSEKSYSCAFWDNPSDTFADISTQPNGERCVSFVSEAGSFSLFLMENETMEGLW